MRRISWIRMVIAMSILLAAMPGWSAGGEGAKTAVSKSPEGAQFPVCWKYTFSALPELVAGKDVEVTITVVATLFDMKEVVITPETSEALTLVSGTGWKGALKKGEARALTFTVRPTQEGFNGLYGVTVKAPGFYDEVAAFVNAQKEGSYADPSWKLSILEQLDGMKEDEPVCEEWFGSSIELPTKGGK